MSNLSSAAKAILTATLLTVVCATHAQPQTENECRGLYKYRKLPDEELARLVTNHTEWLASGNRGEGDLNDPRRANLCGADLSGANLRGADLSGARLERADLSGADLSGADVSRAVLNWADLSGALLFEADLIDAGLFEADLSEASLFKADLSGAILVGADLSGTVLGEANLSGVYFEPKALPSTDSIADALNLFMMRYFASPRTLVSIRKAFKEAGFRRQEREITFAIRHTERQLAWSKEGTITQKAESLFNYIFFEITTKWGMSPGRALGILILLIGVFTIPYIAVLLAGGKDGIWRVWSDESLRKDLSIKDSSPIKVGRLRAIRLGFYFSVLSAFHVGWRDLNVGSWIARIQRREYTLRATGWVRTVSGIQSLISVYLLAMWALTYFGRPFE